MMTASKAASTAAVAGVTLLAAALPATLADGRLSFGTAVLVPRPGGKQCSLAPDTGPCDGDFRRYFFDAIIGCQPFQYGGCEGNANNFKTVEACERACGGADLPVCEQPIIPGPCKGSFPRWGYNDETGECEKFIYGGCGGNKNNFMTEAECEAACDDEPVDVCELDIVPGPCEAFDPSWAFNGGECVEFVYGGCGGNGNRFATQEECEAACEGGDVCSLPLDVGPCEALVPVWGFEGGECVEWTYGGCQGNGNRFNSQAECEDACGGGGGVDICTLPIFPPEQEVFCRAAIPRWTYDGKKGCVEFVYSGCGGTANIFESEKECLAACGKE